jgi:hypothetical protein
MYHITAYPYIIALGPKKPTLNEDLPTASDAWFPASRGFAREECVHARVGLLANCNRS